jgi:hypothetical protein
MKVYERYLIKKNDGQNNAVDRSRLAKDNAVPKSYTSISRRKSSHLTKFLDLIRGDLTAAPTNDEPVSQIPQAAPTTDSPSPKPMPQFAQP